MRDLTVSHPAIATVRIIDDALDPADDNIDVIVELRDGRRFSFTVFTPANLARLIEGRLSYVSPGLLVVHRITDDAIIDAVTDAIYQGIEHFGILQR